MHIEGGEKDQRRGADIGPGEDRLCLGERNEIGRCEAHENDGDGGRALGERAGEDAGQELDRVAAGRA